MLLHMLSIRHCLHVGHLVYTHRNTLHMSLNEKSRNPGEKKNTTDSNSLIVIAEIYTKEVYNFFFLLYLITMSIQINNIPKYVDEWNLKKESYSGTHLFLFLVAGVNCIRTWLNYFVNMEIQFVPVI